MVIREAIQFVEEFERETTPLIAREEWLGEKFCIINTAEDNGKLNYVGTELLEDDENIKNWLEHEKDYVPVFNKLHSFILPLTINSAMGSSSGLATYSFFIFKLSKKNIEGFEQKVKNTKFNDDNDGKVNIEQVQDILLAFKNNFELNKNTDDSLVYGDYYVIIHVSPHLFNTWLDIVNGSISKKLSQGSKDTVEGKCGNCQKSGELSNPSFYTGYDGEKIFLKHKTKVSTKNDERPLLLCGDCVAKLNKFKNIIYQNKLKIFPLFIDSELKWEEIKLIKENTENNSFSFIFEQLGRKNRLNDRCDFYLFINSKDYFFFDFITNYEWNMGKFKNFFEQTNPVNKNRRNMEEFVANILDVGWINYFEDKPKGKDNHLTSLIHSIRPKLFEFVYRNSNSFTSNDLEKIIIYRIDKDINNRTIFEQKIRDFLNIFFNKHLFGGNNMEEKKVLLNKIKNMKQALLVGQNDRFEIRDNEEWAYWAGQIAYYLVSMSKKDKLDYGLLEPFTNKSTTNLVKFTIQELFEKYKHAIDMNNSNFKSIISKVLDYQISESFINLKIYFYVGVFDDNILNQKAQEGQ